MQTSQEELKSTNEELQSTNEELQSTNEELTTSKEEMQSMNEELQTVNHELQAKVDELSRSNNDMKNLLEQHRHRHPVPRRRAPRAALHHARRPRSSSSSRATSGRPITDIASDLDYPELADDAREVLRTLVFKEKAGRRPRDGRWFTVRIMPYRTLENVIDGVVITFTDITASKTLERSCADTQSALEKRVSELEAELKEANKKIRAGDRPAHNRGGGPENCTGKAGSRREAPWELKKPSSRG